LTGYEKFLEFAQPEFIRDNPIPMPKSAWAAKLLLSIVQLAYPNPSNACGPVAPDLK
jgi:hypothetical protein